MARDSLTPIRSCGLIERDLEAPFHSLHRDSFDDIFHGSLQASSELRGPIMPSIDVSETDGEVRIRAELPGVNDSDIDLSLDGDVFVIRGEKKFEKTDDKENYHFVERSYGTFQRALQLPCPVNPGEEQEKSRRIPVRGGEHVSTPSSEQLESAKSKQRAQAGQQGGDANPDKT